MSSLKCSGFILDAMLWNSVPHYTEMPGDLMKPLIHLMCHSWLSVPMGTLPNEDVELARIARVTAEKWQEIRPIIFQNWEIDGNRIYDPDLRKQVMSLRKKKIAGATGWTNTRRKIAADVARENGKKHVANPKRKPEHNAEQ